MIKTDRSFYKTILKPTLFSLAFFGLVSFYGQFFGTVSIQAEWYVKDYKIQYIKEQGFSGGPLMEYELFKYASVPGFLKHVESKVDSSNIENCDVKFNYEHFDFNRCAN